MKIINNLNNKTVQLIFVILLCFSSIISTFYFALLPGMGITGYYGFKPQVYMISIVILGSCLINVLCIIYMATKSFKRLMRIIKKKEIPGNTCKTVNATHSKSTNSRKNRLKIILTRALLIILCIYIILFNFIIYIFYCIFFNSVEIRIFEILPIAIVILNIYSIVSVYRISVRKLLKQ